MKMSENEGKRIRRSPEERAAAVDEQIAKINQTIEELEQKKKAVLTEYDDKIAAAKGRIKALGEKKKAILAPKKPRKTKAQKIKAILSQAQKAGMQPEEIAERLGVAWEE